MSRLHERRWRQDRTGWGDPIPGRSGVELRSRWNEPGPWHVEPDKVQWVDSDTDLDCLAVRNRFGSWCGYVGLPPTHPLHGKGYDEVHDATDIDVHGSITYAAGCDEHADEDSGICHVPAPGRPADVWWLGFDCGHSCDVSPRRYVIRGMEDLDDTYLGHPVTYRTLGYVQDECHRLADQLARYAPASGGETDPT